MGVGEKEEPKGFVKRTLESLANAVPKRLRRAILPTIAGLTLLAGSFQTGRVYERNQMPQRTVVESIAPTNVHLYSPDTSSWRHTPGTDPTPDVYTVVVKRGDTVSEIVERVRRERPELRVGPLYPKNGQEGQNNIVARASAKLPGQENLLDDTVIAGGIPGKDNIIGDTAKEGQVLVFEIPAAPVEPAIAHQTPPPIAPLTVPTVTPPLSSIAPPHVFAESVLGTAPTAYQTESAQQPGTALVLRDTYNLAHHGAVTAQAMAQFDKTTPDTTQGPLENAIRDEGLYATPSPARFALSMGAIALLLVGAPYAYERFRNRERNGFSWSRARRKRSQKAEEPITPEPPKEQRLLATGPSWRATLTERYTSQGVAELERVIEEYASLRNANLETGEAFYNLYKVSTPLREELRADAKLIYNENPDDVKRYRILGNAVEAAFVDTIKTLDSVGVDKPYINAVALNADALVFVRRLYDRPVDEKTLRRDDLSAFIDGMRERAGTPTL